MSTVAVIGLGRMGGPMADNLLAAGHEVRVFDVDPDAVAPRAAAGAVAASSPADAARGANVVCIVVFDDTQAIDVITGADGALTALDAGAVVAVHTTVSLDTIESLAGAGRAAGIHVIDAGISGGEPGAGAGTLLTMVGGAPEAVELARPVLDGFSKEVLHAGPLGAGMALKLARNATGYAMMAAVHEALDLALRSGVPAATLERVIGDSGVLDQALSTFVLGGPDPLPDDAPAAQRASMEHLERLAAKDLDAALDLAERVGADVTALTAVRRMYRHVARLGPEVARD